MTNLQKMRHPQQKLHFHHKLCAVLVKNATSAAKVALPPQTLCSIGKKCDIRTKSYTSTTNFVQYW
jgi:hypothetical protein